MRISDWSSDVCSSDLHRKPGRFGNDTAEAAMTKPLFEAAQERSLVASLDVDDPVGVETGQREGRREQVGLRHAPEYLAFDAREDAGREHGGGGRKIGRASCRERVCQ